MPRQNNIIRFMIHAACGFFYVRTKPATSGARLSCEEVIDLVLFWISENQCLGNLVGAGGDRVSYVKLSGFLLNVVFYSVPWHCDCDVIVIQNGNCPAKSF